MDTRTGEIHELGPGESIAALARQLGGVPKDFVPVNHLPSPVCPKCKGTGAIRKGLFSKRFKPCKCTF